MQNIFIYILCCCSSQEMGDVHFTDNKMLAQGLLVVSELSKKVYRTLSCSHPSLVNKSAFIWRQSVWSVCVNRERKCSEVSCLCLGHCNVLCSS